MKWFDTAKKATVVLLGATMVFGYVGASGVATAKTSAEPGAAAQEAKQREPGFKGSIYLGQEQNINEKKSGEVEGQAAKEDATDPTLAAKARISPAQAEAAALKAFPDAKVVKTELGDENGYLVYQVELTDRDGQSIDIKVDAGNGQVLAQEKGADSIAENKESESEKAGLEADTDNVQMEQEGEYQN